MDAVETNNECNLSFELMFSSRRQKKICSPCYNVKFKNYEIELLTIVLTKIT